MTLAMQSDRYATAGAIDPIAAARTSSAAPTHVVPSEDARGMTRR
jgi:hypothetical protein